MVRRSKHEIFEGDIKEDGPSLPREKRDLFEEYLPEDERKTKRKLREISFLASLRHQW